MIVFDKPRVWSEARGLTAHLMSTKYGMLATEELVAFGKKLRLERRDLQNQGSPVLEHFDLKGTKIDTAIKHGATEISASDLARLMQQKRAEQQLAIAVVQRRAGRPVRMIEELVERRT